MYSKRSTVMVFSLATIAIVHIALDGHAMPAIRIGGAFARRGHQVIAWGPQRYRQRIEASGTRFRPYDPFDVRPSAGVDDFPVAVVEGTEQTLERLADEILAAEADLVLHDTQATWGYVAGELLGLPRIVSHPFLPGFIGRPWPRNLPAELLERLEASLRRIEHSWAVEFGSWRAALLTAGHATVCPTTSLFAGERLPAGWHYVGPLIDPAPAAEGAPGRPLVYVALGTMYNRRLEPFVAAISALADEPVDVLLAVAGSPARDLLGALPANVSVHEYVESLAVLGRASVHVTHAGASSVHESLVAGVPMVCMPQGSDNAGWAARVEAVGAGEVVAEEAEAVRLSVRRLLEDERPRARARELGEHFARYDGADRLDAVAADLLGSER